MFLCQEIDFPHYSRKHVKECFLLHKVQRHFIPQEFPNEHMGVNDKFLYNLIIREQAEIFKKIYHRKKTNHCI